MNLYHGCKRLRSKSEAALPLLESRLLCSYVLAPCFILFLSNVLIRLSEHTNHKDNCDLNLEKSPSKKRNITLDRNYRNAIGSSKRANEKTEHSILPKIPRWQTFHLQRNN